MRESDKALEMKQAKQPHSSQSPERWAAKAKTTSPRFFTAGMLV